MVNGKQKYLGLYTTIEEATEALRCAVESQE